MSMPVLFFGYSHWTVVSLGFGSEFLHRYPFHLYANRNSTLVCVDAQRADFIVIVELKIFTWYEPFLFILNWLLETSASPLVLVSYFYSQILISKTFRVIFFVSNEEYDLH